MDILNSENLFLIILAFVWIIGAVLQDLRRREVDNIWNFSLIAFALAYRASVSIYTGDYWFILNGILGLIIFLILGNVFYYSRLFAGGDAKLLISLGTILPLSYNWMTNIKIFGLFIILFLVAGSIYALLWAIVLVFKNWKKFIKEYKKLFLKYKKLFFICFAIVFIWFLFIIIFHEISLILFGIIIILFPFLFIFAKSVEESCMIESLPPTKITEGDWLYKDIKIGSKKIESTWDGVSRRELGLIRNKYPKNILVKQGIPFTPAFLFGLIILLYIIWKYTFLF